MKKVLVRWDVISMKDFVVPLNNKELSGLAMDAKFVFTFVYSLQNRFPSHADTKPKISTKKETELHISNSKL